MQSKIGLCKKRGEILNYITHSLGGVAVGMAVLGTTGIGDPIQQTTIMGAAVLGALFPDIDHKQSWMGHKAPIVAEIVSGLFKHRGFLHTPVFIMAVWTVLTIGMQIWLESPDELYVALLFRNAFISGMLSHLILDILNIQGIMWLWPVSKKRQHILSIRTGSLGETVACAALGAVLFGLHYF